MYSTVLEKVKTVKCVLIILIILCVGLSLLDCKQYQDTAWSDIGDKLVTVTYTQNCFSVFVVVLAGCQILLILHNRWALQVIPAILSAGNIILPLLTMKLLKALDEMIVYVMAPPNKITVQEWTLTPMGYCYVVLEGLMLVVSVVVAFWGYKQKAMLSENVKREGNEVVE